MSCRACAGRERDGVLAERGVIEPARIRCPILVKLEADRESIVRCPVEASAAPRLRTPGGA